MLSIGDTAIDFTLKDANGDEITLSQFKGKKIVLYFYPKDNTPGWTSEAKSFVEVYDEITNKNTVIIGISPDSETSHKKFKEKYNIPFILLSDPEHNVCEAYGAWGEKKMYGKSYMGVKRITYIIDEEFKVIKIFDKVSPKEHGKEVLEIL